METPAEKQEAFEKAQAAVRQVQGFDPKSLRLIGEGEQQGSLVPGAACIVSAFLRLTPHELLRLSSNELKNIKSIAESVHENFQMAIELDGDKLARSENFETTMRTLEYVCLYEISELRTRDERDASSVLPAMRDALVKARNQMQEMHAQADKAKSEVEAIVADAKGGIAASEKSMEESVQGARSLHAEARNLQSGMEDMAAKAKSDIEKQQSSMTKTLQDKIDSLQGQVTDLAVSGGAAAYFADTGKKHATASYAWLAAVVVEVLLLAAYAVWGDELFPVNFREKTDIELTYAVWRTVAARVLVFTVLAYALFFSARNYAAERHNAVVNRHRQNALSTYRALVEANSTPENRDIVLAHAARCIFAPQESGYARGGGTDSGGISVFETIRHAADKTNPEKK